MSDVRQVVKKRIPEGKKFRQKRDGSADFS